MSGFLLRIIINAVILFIVMIKLPGIFVDTLGGTLLGAAIVGVANAAIRPLFAVTDLPLTILNLGGVTVMTNIFTPLMVIKALPGFQVSGTVTSMVGLVLMTLCSFALSKVIHDR